MTRSPEEGGRFADGPFAGRKRMAYHSTRMPVYEYDEEFVSKYKGQYLWEPEAGEWVWERK